MPSAPATSHKQRSGAEEGVGSCGEDSSFKVVWAQERGGDLGRWGKALGPSG